MSVATSRCEALKQRMVALRRLEALHTQAKQIDTRRSELEARRLSMAAAALRAAVLKERGHLDGASWPDVSDATAILTRVRDRLVENPGEITAGRDYKQLLERTEQATKALDGAVSVAWSSVRNAASPVDERLLQRLALVPGQAVAVANVRALNAELQRLAANPPATTEAYDAFDRAAKAVLAAWRALDHGDLPESVVAFFKAAQNVDGAPEALWTDEVRAWLRTHGMLSGVRLHYRGGR
jgi:hypothetical protein